MPETSASARIASSSGVVGSPPSAPDYDEIVAVIRLYIDGLNEADKGKLRECFHENAWWACTTEDGSLDQHRVEDSLDNWVGDTMPKDFVHRILSVTQAGDVASVMLEMHRAAAGPSGAALGWIDIHALLRIEGVWKDMNKTATHATRAGWAGVPVAGSA